MFILCVLLVPLFTSVVYRTQLSNCNVTLRYMYNNLEHTPLFPLSADGVFYSLVPFICSYTYTRTHLLIRARIHAREDTHNNTYLRLRDFNQRSRPERKAVRVQHQFLRSRLDLSEGFNVMISSLICEKVLMN